MKNKSFHRRIHRWLGLALSLLCVVASLTGVLLNHRQALSPFDLPRSWLPDSYAYENGNQAALRGSVTLGDGSSAWYGDGGIWREVDGEWAAWDAGLPPGAGARKVVDLLLFHDQWIAAMECGLFRWEESQWRLLALPTRARLADLFIKEDRLGVLTRSELFETLDGETFVRVDLPRPEGGLDDSLFSVLWRIHSGEFFGLPGKLVVDLLAILMILLCVTGWTYFLIPRRIRRAGSTAKRFKQHRAFHLKVGSWTVVFLVIITATGMFLRPPLLIPIANVRVPVFFKAAHSNPWHDRLRRGAWDIQAQRYILSTKEGFYFYSAELGMRRSRVQPPVSVMGCTVLEQVSAGKYMVGSFSGLFLWSLENGDVVDLFSRAPMAARARRPVSDHMVTGLVLERDGAWLIDYRKGIIPAGAPSARTVPPQLAADGRISLWNLCLEIHTGRIFEPLVGMFYILYVPLLGLGMLVVLISGWVRLR